MDALQGTWTCLSGTIDGNPLPHETARTLTMELSGDRYTTRRGDEVLFDGLFRVDLATDPASIDIIATDGAHAGQAALGIIALDGDDRCTLCYTMPGGARPSTFSSPSGSGIFLVSWSRASGHAKPADAEPTLPL